MNQSRWVQPGFRPAHAKGLMCAGTFAASSEAAKLTRAPHASRPSTPVTVRYSNGTGLPTMPDNDPARSGPRGIAVRFHLADHVHTDIIAHSMNAFPVRTGEEFVEFLRAAAAAGVGKPEPLGAFISPTSQAVEVVMRLVVGGDRGWVGDRVVTDLWRRQHRRLRAQMSVRLWSL